jgi:hypothetical protein
MSYERQVAQSFRPSVEFGALKFHFTLLILTGIKPMICNQIRS